MSIEAGVVHAMEWVALGVQLAAALVLVIGAVEALVRVFAIVPRLSASLGEKRMIWLHFARWLVLALEFELAADVVSFRAGAPCAYASRRPSRRRR